MEVCNCSMFCCTLLYVHSSFAIILMGKRELIALLNLSSWCLVMVEQLFLALPRGCLQFVIVVFSDHTHLLFLKLEMAQNTLSQTKGQTKKLHKQRINQTQQKFTYRYIKTVKLYQLTYFIIITYQSYYHCFLYKYD